MGPVDELILPRLAWLTRAAHLHQFPHFPLVLGAEVDQVEILDWLRTDRLQILEGGEEVVGLLEGILVGGIKGYHGLQELTQIRLYLFQLVGILQELCNPLRGYCEHPLLVGLTEHLHDLLAHLVLLGGLGQSLVQSFILDFLLVEALLLTSVLHPLRVLNNKIEFFLESRLITHIFDSVSEIRDKSRHSR